jgi:hypothetical protein
VRRASSIFAFIVLMCPIFPPFFLFFPFALLCGGSARRVLGGGRDLQQRTVVSR